MFNRTLTICLLLSTGLALQGMDKKDATTAQASAIGQEERLKKLTETLEASNKLIATLEALLVKSNTRLDAIIWTMESRLHVGQQAEDNSLSNAL